MTYTLRYLGGENANITAYSEKASKHRVDGWMAERWDRQVIKQTQQTIEASR